MQDQYLEMKECLNAYIEKIENDLVLINLNSSGVSDNELITSEF